jgi:hypothetical protein
MVEVVEMVVQLLLLVVEEVVLEQLDHPLVHLEVLVLMQMLEMVVMVHQVQ